MVFLAFPSPTPGSDKIELSGIWSLVLIILVLPTSVFFALAWTRGLVFACRIRRTCTSWTRGPRLAPFLFLIWLATRLSCDRLM